MGYGAGRRATRAVARRLAQRPALFAVFEVLVAKIVALDPVAVALFGSAHAGARPVDRFTDLDLAVVVAAADDATRLRRRLRAAVRAAGEIVAWGWWGDQALGLVRRDGEWIGVDVHVVEQARLAYVGRMPLCVLFDPQRVLARRPVARRRASRVAADDLDVAIGLAWRARVRVARGDRIEADHLLHEARNLLVPVLRHRSGAAARANLRGVERDLSPATRRALSRCRPCDLSAHELLRAAAATLGYAERQRRSS